MDKAVDDSNNKILVTELDVSGLDAPRLTSRIWNLETLQVFRACVRP